MWLESFALRLASFLCVLMAATVLWSEVTFFSRHDPDPNSAAEDKPTGIDLSIWSILIHANGLSNLACQVRAHTLPHAPHTHTRHRTQHTRHRTRMQV